MTYIETRSKSFASKNLHKFDTIISKYNIDINIYKNKEYCEILYNDYKKICKFDNIIQISYIFENDKDLYNNLKYGMKNVNNRNDFKNLFVNDLSNIYKIVFGKEYKRLSYIEKISVANESIQKINKCIIKRIQYHYWCKTNQIKYNIKSHEHEILLSIYMYNRIIEVMELLNIYYEKYKIFKEELQKKKEELQKEEEEFDNLETTSHTISEEAYKYNTKNKKRTNRRK